MDVMEVADERAVGAIVRVAQLPRPDDERFAQVQLHTEGSYKHLKERWRCRAWREQEIHEGDVAGRECLHGKSHAVEEDATVPGKER